MIKSPVRLRHQAKQKQANEHQLVGRPMTVVCLVCARSVDRNLGEPIICSAPIWRERGENQESVRVLRELGEIRLKLILY